MNGGQLIDGVLGVIIGSTGLCIEMGIDNRVIMGKSESVAFDVNCVDM